MSRPKFEIADIIKRFSKQYIEKYHPNSYIINTLKDLEKCRTAELGYHEDKCDNESCGKKRISYNSCGNRHCPKCQSVKQAFWVDDLLEMALDVKHYHIVFTVPHELNEICLLGSKWFYGQLFAAVWDTLRTFGYSHFGVESGAVCMLHTWGQNMSLHPHIHCIVPAAGETLAGHMKLIGGDGKFLYPVKQLSPTFRGKLMQIIKKMLKKEGLLPQYQSLIDKAWGKPWNVNCEPSFGKPEHVVKYLGQYTHRVAITNHRLLNIDDNGITFLHKDYAHGAEVTPTHLDGVEFLRRFCMHILPLRFVKSRRYGIYSSRYRALQKKNNKKMSIVPKKKETTQERILRLTGFDVYQCPFCKTGRMHTVEIVPRARAPNNWPNQWVQYKKQP
jgi:hypothetical protein